MKTFYSKCLAAALAMFAGASVANAAADLYPEAMTVNSYDPMELNIMLDFDNETPVNALNFEILLPDGLEFDYPLDRWGDPVYDDYEPNWNMDRFANGQTPAFAPSSSNPEHYGRVAIISSKGYNFKGNEGVLVSFPVKAVNNALISYYNDEVVLRGIVLLTGMGETLAEVQSVTTSKAEVVFSPGQFSYEATTTTINTLPGQKFTVGLGLNNNEPVAALQFRVKMPEGFNFIYDDEAEDNPVVLSDRCAKYANADVRNFGNIANVTITMLNGKDLMKEGTGEFITFEVQAPEDFEGEATIIIEEGVVTVMSDGESIGVPVDNVEIMVFDATSVCEQNYIDYEADMEKWQQLLDDFTNAIENINENFPEAGVEEMAEDINAAIFALWSEMDAAYNEALDALKPYVFEGLDEKIAEIEGEIAQMVSIAEANGVAGIEAEGNGAVYYGIDGRVIANPAAGQMVIIVRDGKATKHIVK